MENASRALLMAAGILIGILILTLVAVLFMAGNEVFSGYEETKTSEMIQRFNGNFTKYLGKSLTAHEALTIINFARNNHVKVTVDAKFTNTTQINTDVSGFTGDSISSLQHYTLTITKFSDEGYVKEIAIN